jgi:hypothetical protein
LCTFSTGPRLVAAYGLPVWFAGIPLGDLWMSQPRFPPPNPDQCVFMWTMLDQCVLLHENCNVYKRLWEGQFPSHPLNRSRGPISILAEVHIPSAAVSVWTQLKLTLWSFLETMSEFHTVKCFSLQFIG